MAHFEQFVRPLCPECGRRMVPIEADAYTILWTCARPGCPTVPYYTTIPTRGGTPHDAK